MAEKIKKKNKIFCSERENKVLGYFEKLLNVLIFFLLLGLTFIIFKEMYELFFIEILSLEVKFLIDSVLFSFILIELFTVLFSYLKRGYIKVERIVEVGIISIVRDLIFHSFDMEITRIYSLSGFLLVLGALFFIEKHFSRDRNL